MYCGGKYVMGSAGYSWDAGVNGWDATCPGGTLMISKSSPLVVEDEVVRV